MPWGQRQKSAVVPPYVGVGAVSAALRRFVFNTALPGSLLLQKEARPRQEVAWALGGPWRKRVTG